MRRLIRLVTPPGGIILNPFAGSGTTLEAGLSEGYRVIGIERDPSYVPLIEARARPSLTQKAERPTTTTDKVAQNRAGSSTQTLF